MLFRSDQAFDFQMGAIDVAGLFSPDFSEGKEFSMPDGEMSATIGPMQLGIDGKQLMTFAGGKSNGRYDSATQVYSGEGTLDGLYINVMEFPVKPEQRKGLEQFAALGYDSVTLNGEFAGSWNVAEGTLDMTKYRLSADDMAAFDMAVSLGGYTIELGRQLQKISQAMNGAEDDETRQALSFQMLAAMSALTVREIRLTLEDDSLTGRVLEMQAAKAGQKKEDLVAAAPFMIGAMMGPLEIPEFASALSAAVGSFMSNPGKLTLSAKPGAPVSVAEIMGLGAAVKAGSVKPSEVIERFNVAVEAN